MVPSCDRLNPRWQRRLSATVPYPIARCLASRILRVLTVWESYHSIPDHVPDPSLYKAVCLSRDMNVCLRDELDAASIHIAIIEWTSTSKFQCCKKKIQQFLVTDKGVFLILQVSTDEEYWIYMREAFSLFSMLWLREWAVYLWILLNVECLNYGDTSILPENSDIRSLRAII